jgi:hypothetical protein
MTLLGHLGWAQSDSLGQRVIRAKCKTAYVQLPPERRLVDGSWPFREIRVLDYRRDTARIGLISNSWGNQEQVVFQRTSASRALAAWLDSTYTQPKGDYSLLVVIKDLWFADNFLRRLNFAFRLEAYLCVGDGYIPLTYKDTAVTCEGAVSIIVQRRIPQLTAMFMDEAGTMDLPRAIARRSPIPMAAVDSFCTRGFRHPIDTALQPVRGVYKSARTGSTTG